MNINLTDTQIEQIVSINDLDEAVLEIQQLIGQNDGGVAGVFFSNDDKVEGWNDPTQRKKIIEEYLECERSYDGLIDEQ